VRNGRFEGTLSLSHGPDGIAPGGPEVRNFRFGDLFEPELAVGVENQSFYFFPLEIKGSCQISATEVTGNLGPPLFNKLRPHNIIINEISVTSSQKG
jgi:hypothetical protein